MCSGFAASTETMVGAGAPGYEIGDEQMKAGERLLSELAPDIADGYLSSRRALRQIFSAMFSTVESNPQENRALPLSHEQWRACVHGGNVSAIIFPGSAFGRNDNPIGKLSGSNVPHEAWTIKFLSACPSSILSIIERNSMRSGSSKWRFPRARKMRSNIEASMRSVIILPSFAPSRRKCHMVSCMALSSLDEATTTRPIRIC